MAAVQGLHVSCMSTTPERIVCSCSSFSSRPNHAKTMLRNSHRPKQGCLLLCSRSTNRTRSFQSVSFQDVAENESDGNESTSPSTSSSAPTLDRDRVWQQLQGSLQHWGRNLSDRGSLHIAKQFMAITEIRIKNKDAKNRIFRTIKVPDLSTLWANIDPSIKWPVAVFIPLYVIVRASCGVAVSRELWPLWTIWPLAMSFYIQAGVYVGRAVQTRAPFVGDTIAKMVTYAKSGKLPQDLRNAVLVMVPTYYAEKRDATMVYLRTRAASDLKASLIKLAIWILEKYEDFVDWVWPSWRILWRTLMNLF